jgi:phage recombination protein Bet
MTTPAKNNLTAMNYPSLLLSKDNKEVVKHFEDHYVEHFFKHFLALKVPADDIVKFFHKAQITGADPLKDQIYLIPRNTKIKKDGREEWVTVGTVVFSYHFVESKAVETKEYEGYTIKTGVASYFDPIAGKAKDMLMSECIVTRNGKTYPFTAWWDEYVQTNSYGVTTQWKTKPHLMLEKCAKAGALRSAFPEWLSGAYTQEEMGAIEKDDDAISAEFTRKEEVEKKEEIQARIDQKIESADNMDKIEGLLQSIQTQMGTLTTGLDLKAKGKAMVEHLGVNKFDDLKKKSLADLELKDKELKEVLAEKQKREFDEAAKKTGKDPKNTKPTFNLNGDSNNA